MVWEIVQKILPFIWVYLVILIFVASYKGMLYDNEKEKEDVNYKDCHSFSFKRGKFWFALPRLVSTKNATQIANKAAKAYNKIVINIWVTIICLTILYVFFI